MRTSKEPCFELTSMQPYIVEGSYLAESECNVMVLSGKLPQRICIIDNTTSVNNSFLYISFTVFSTVLLVYLILLHWFFLSSIHSIFHFFFLSVSLFVDTLIHYKSLKECTQTIPEPLLCWADDPVRFVD
jgi:hypothetical protein